METSTQSVDSLAQYLSYYRKIKNENSSESNLPVCKVALLSSFTINGLAEVLTVKAHHEGVKLDVFAAGYNQWAQEILNPTSPLYTFAPQLIFIAVDVETLLGDEYVYFYRFETDEVKARIEEAYRNFKNLVVTLQKQTNATIVIHNFEIPARSVLGVAETKQVYSRETAIATLNERLRVDFLIESQVYIFDFNNFVAFHGKQRVHDYKYYYLGDFRLAPPALVELAASYLPYITLSTGKIKKCLVLDLDNTLWGGTVGEDGYAHLRLGPTVEGKSFWEFQKYILSLYDRGIILAINSNNNFEDAIEVIKNHPGMILREEHFASVQINWNDKISKLRAIAEELNIGMDSLVFIDDDKVNRDLVRQALPEVTVIDLPEDVSYYLPTLMYSKVFDTLQFTSEDKVKGALYAADRQRSVTRQNFQNIDEYLADLKMDVTIFNATDLSFPRLAQLTQKTNQFNLTTRRYSEADIAQFQTNGTRVWGLQVQDKFGDNGIVGLAILKPSHTEWYIDTLLMSCRVIGRKIEECFLGTIINQAREAGAQTVVGEYIPTKKNKIVEHFYKEHGFVPDSSDATGTRWLYHITTPCHLPAFITLHTHI